MAVNKDKNSYTFLFAIIMVVIVGSCLAAISMGLKPAQEKNQVVKKKMDILNAIKIQDVSRLNAIELYDKYILEDECIVLNEKGEITGAVAFDVDIQKEYKNKNLPVAERQYPLYVAEIDGSKKYVIPVIGSGLWGPIWGYIAVSEDKKTIFGATFDHKGETPGLGAEIKQSFFTNQYDNETISEDGNYKKIKVVKDGSGTEPQKVDGITGGTITSKGVEEMVDRTLQVYVNYFNK
ncbi:NADH:ubiquinone reductase (Na(+)-transporting) subunit C [Crocinitomix catalasitica]|uniref:NADH:ubiquinone reductase (Na(+)-transporting) subunit C n=1 Tax=Crocinitomix catalasitica TaxID=184607 RepID=UPI000567336C|nr:NADH:ubiquinone reductase (Na(+)-transporting) subunit C [Crocinitomix catalasitica]